MLVDSHITAPPFTLPEANWLEESPLLGESGTYLDFTGDGLRVAAIPNFPRATMVAAAMTYCNAEKDIPGADLSDKIKALGVEPEQWQVLVIQEGGDRKMYIGVTFSPMEFPHHDPERNGIKVSSCILAEMNYAEAPVILKHILDEQVSCQLSDMNVEYNGYAACPSDDLSE